MLSKGEYSKVMRVLKFNLSQYCQVSVGSNQGEEMRNVIMTDKYTDKE